MEQISLLPAGFNKDLPPEKAPDDVWNDARNVLFNDGFAANAPGWLSAPVVLPGKPLYLLPYFTPLVYWWLVAGNNDAGTAGFLAVTDGTNTFDITPVGGLSVTAAGDWTGGVLNGVPFVNNGIDAPVWWDGVTVNPATTLPDWPANTTCKALRPFKFHLLAMNITDPSGTFGDLVLHSDAADPGTIPQSWTPDPSNQAGSFSIGAIPGELLDGWTLRDSFVVYKQSSSALITFAGGRFIFGQRGMFVETGILARNCARELFGQHYTITDGDIVRHNGQEVVSLVDGQLREWLFSQIDATSFEGAHVAIDHGNKQVWFNFPKVGSSYCDLSLVWDLTSQRMGVVEYAPFAYMSRGILGDLGGDNSFDAATGTFDAAQGIFDRQQFNPTSDQLIFCRFEEKQLNYLVGAQRNGAESTCLLQLLSKDLGQGTAYKTVDKLWVNAEGNSFDLQDVISVRFGAQESSSDPIRWSPVQSLYRNKSASYGISGRLISIELQIRQRDAWRINGLDLDYFVDGGQ